MNTMIKSFFLSIASAIQGMAMAVFLFPHFIPSGGAASVSVLMNDLLDIPFSITLWVLNAALLAAAVKWLGKSSALWTILCVTITSLTIEWISPNMSGPVSNVFVDILLGAGLFGVGVGILFKLGASSGGMDILALIISKLSGKSPGRILFVINASLLLLTGIIIGFTIIVYALICQFIATKVIDFIYTLEIKQSVLNQKA
ncbi:YitT family protein [Rossellomorea aquimaris]|uniref:YitT family protein n=1 Tax=Rossellomorea aquimaris TaxID=189382 RepID=UPI001CD38250|nr:YitT family protein [Rossellomorea aquimaris]MCA1053676.1 YitT family protein [Rossellomorea aquimaris]